ncbi:polymorphic toxin type 37 domain-containing protein [Sneathiella sp.]|uniref:polymorphic toxin type 37 domain-containing protein n=1 Tax=Sneathiella sp. TaxID=1964365 RepID=UPI003FA78FC5
MVVPVVGALIVGGVIIYDLLREEDPKQCKINLDISSVLSLHKFGSKKGYAPPPLHAVPAPGKPGPEDGYVPPKKRPKNADKDGRVPNPNGPGKGWPAADGGVWVPTGEGAYGGPHWDVQYPGGGYVNVHPGGKRRGGKKSGKRK